MRKIEAKMMLVVTVHKIFLSFFLLKIVTGVDNLDFTQQAVSYMLFAGPLGLMGIEPARQTSEPGSNPSWDATVHLVCETFNVMHVVACI